MTSHRNQIFARLQTTPSFTHTPSKDRVTTAIRQLDDEGILLITNIGQADDLPCWRVDRGVNW